MKMKENKAKIESNKKKKPFDSNLDSWPIFHLVESLPVTNSADWQVPR